MRPSRLHLLPALSLAAILAACASGPPQATVQVFTSQPQLPAGSTYRYERLPSQAAQPRQAELEAAADAVLARAGLRRDEAAARLAVQLTATQDSYVSGPGWGGSPSVGIGIGGGSWGSGVGIGLGIPIGGGGGATQSSQRVDVQMRDLGTGRVVFQSQASAGSGATPVALLDAALRDFPNAPPGARQVPLAATTAR
jgi:hypothetical protein